MRVDEVVRAIVERALVKRPVEIALPRRRALLAKVAGGWPAVASLLTGRMTRLGKRKQARLP